MQKYKEDIKFERHQNSNKNFHSIVFQMIKLRLFLYKLIEKTQGTRRLTI